MERTRAKRGTVWAPVLGALAVLIWLAAPVAAGDMVDASCPCGYHQEHIPLFGGRASFKKLCMFPALCMTNKQLTLVNVLDPGADPRGCKAKDAVRYDSPSLAPAKPGAAVASWRLPDGRVFQLYEGGYVCPRCGRPTLRFKHSGNWD